jgi:uncharacterized protein (DUF1015 family)
MILTERRLEGSRCVRKIANNPTRPGIAGLLLQPTPLHALEELAKHDEVMPQKSTYFYSKSRDWDGDG